MYIFSQSVSRFDVGGKDIQKGLKGFMYGEECTLRIEKKGQNMSLGLIYKNAAHIFDEVEKKTPYLEYPLFQETGIVTSAFYTRLGGVSEGYYSSLNLSFDRGDDPARVLENFKRIGASMGVSVEDMVLSKQAHTTNVRVVTKEDKGKGVMRERNYTDVDGMITNVPGICLVTSYADCVLITFHTLHGILLSVAGAG